MRVVMVKKRLSSGEPCGKCAQAEQLLRSRGLWHRVDEVVWALEGQDQSPGMVLSQEFGAEIAPFFVVYPERESPQVYGSTLQLIRDHLSKPATATAERATMLEEEQIEELQRTFERVDPQRMVAWALSRYGRRCGIAFSGAEDVALIDMAVASGLEFSVFCLDTGRLHPETYGFIEKVRMHYGIEIEMHSPDAEQLRVFVQRKGLFSFYKDGHKECCGIRKVAPLRRALTQYDAWLTGQRRDQSPATRSNVPLIQLDMTHSGRSGPLVKLNPLANWSSSQTWSYLRAHEVPYNPLHERGFVSIGCEPCTRPILPGQHEREGRWWWETDTLKECGLHSTAPRPVQAIGPSAGSAL